MHVPAVLVVVVFVALCGARSALALSPPFYQPQNYPNRTGIVELFEWTWRDIGEECEYFLGRIGYAGVQISPPTENVVVLRENGDRPWWERYQPISYRLGTRSGDEKDLADMVRKCNVNGVRTYVDLVINHMTVDRKEAVGTNGTKTRTFGMNYPGLYNTSHFHKPRCAVVNYQDPVNVRNCELEGRHDLNHSQPYVRDRIIDLMNRLIDMGVAGFRIDSAKHLWPHDILMLTQDLKPLNTKFGFKPNTKPFIYQEVVDLGAEGISYEQYTHIGRVTDYRYSVALSRIFSGMELLRRLKNWTSGAEWNFVDSSLSVVFVDNHDNQRENYGHRPILNYKNAKKYKMAVAFMLAHPHGYPRIMSSYKFNDWDQGPPMSPNGTLTGRKLKKNISCTGDYICEHRWKEIYNMMRLRTAARETRVTNWWDDNNNQIAFGRGDRAFIAINNGVLPMDIVLQTSLPPGKYCDVITGIQGRHGPSCLGKMVIVRPDGKARFTIMPDEKDGVVAIHVESKVV